MSRAKELVVKALATEQDFFDMDELLGDTGMTDFESDARINAERYCDAENFYNEYRDQRRGVINLAPQGLPEAMTIDFDDRLRTITRAVVARHRQVPSEDVEVIDLHQKYSTSLDMLPPWDIHDPKTANVMRGLIPGSPDRLYILRGRFQPHDLLAMVASQYEIETCCDFGYSDNCDPMASPPMDADRNQRVWQAFPVPHGEFIVYFTMCAACYRDFWHSGQHAGFDIFDPKFDKAV